MDELSVDEGNFFEKHDKDVGHLSSKSFDFLQFSTSPPKNAHSCLTLWPILSNQLILNLFFPSFGQAEGADGFSEFHLYVCGAFLVKWSEQLRKMEFQEIMIFLQSLPTSSWSEKDVELLLSEAFMWKSLFHNSSYLAV